MAVLEARLLLCYVLGCTRSDLISHPERQVSLEQEQAFKDCIKRRLQGEPVSKICGEREFWGLTFKVTPHTLDPRPDTETLVEAVLAQADRGRKLNILDLGTGTGCILLSLLYELPQAHGTAVDVSPLALQVAQGNAQALHLQERTRFILSDWAQDIEGVYDIIVSNPPYITEDEYRDLDRNVKDFDPKSALVSGPDGLECYRKIAPAIHKHLAKNGFFAIEVGVNQEEDVRRILIENNLTVLEIRKDLAGILRCITGCRRDDK